MAKIDKYNLNYKKLYPGIEISPEILTALKQSDRKMKYIEIDLKTERFIHSQEKQTAVFLPSREDSYDRMCEERHIQFAHFSMTPEETLIQNMLLERLQIALTQLANEDRRLIYLRYWEGLTQKETASKLNLTQQAVSYRERQILQKMKKIIEK